MIDDKTLNKWEEHAKHYLSYWSPDNETPPEIILSLIQALRKERAKSSIVEHRSTTKSLMKDIGVEE